jgi:hypothetical protein
MAEFVSKIDEVSTKIDATDSITALSDSYKILCTQIGLKAQDKVASIQQAWREVCEAAEGKMAAWLSASGDAICSVAHDQIQAQTDRCKSSTAIKDLEELLRHTQAEVSDAQFTSNSLLGALSRGAEMLQATGITRAKMKKR